jgi:glutathione peroxidase
MKKLILFIASILIFSNVNAQTIYDFKVTDIEGKVFDMASLKGKKVMIVNTASKCGLTPQFEELQKLYMQFKERNFVIIGFPTNDFFEQDPGTNDEIKSFCVKNYGVTFPMMSKIIVKGEAIEPLYSFLTLKSKNGLEDNHVKWNFQKYLINEQGHLVRVVGPRVKPMDESIVEWIRSK